MYISCDGISSLSSTLFVEVSLSATVFFIKSPVVSLVFYTTLLEAVFAATISVFIAYKFFYHICHQILFANDKKSYTFTYFSLLVLLNISKFVLC